MYYIILYKLNYFISNCLLRRLLKQRKNFYLYYSRKYKYIVIIYIQHNNIKYSYNHGIETKLKYFVLRLLFKYNITVVTPQPISICIY